jgi:hypothetical protein
MKRLLFLILFSVTVSSGFAQGPVFSQGLSFDDNAYNKTLQKAPLTRSMYVLPTTASLKKYCPIPENQGQYGTCVGWSTAYAARTIMMAHKNNWTDKTMITSNTFAPGYIYNLVKNEDDYTCQMGTYIDQALTAMINKGVVKYKDFSKSCLAAGTVGMEAEASKYRIKDFAKIFGLEDANLFKIQATKKSLAENKPVVIGMKCPPSFHYVRELWTPLENATQNFGGHAMCVVGYDDNKDGGAFEIMNSWGTDWASQGFVWVKYKDFADFTKYAYELIEDLRPADETLADLSGKLRFVMPDGKEMAAKLNGTSYKMLNKYPSGTRFRLYISNNEPAYVYSFGSDLTANTYQIFPHKPGISPALTYGKNDVALPDEDHFIEMDDNVGKDYLCFIYSKDPINIDNIRKNVEQQTGTFHEKVRKAFGDKAVDLKNAQFTANEISFSARSQGKSLVYVIVEMEHTE